MPLGMEVGLDPDHIVLDGDPAPPPPKKGLVTGCLTCEFCCFMVVCPFCQTPLSSCFSLSPFLREY